MSKAPFIAASAVSLACAAVPALAQDSLCAGIGNGGQWIGGAEATSDIAGLPAPLDATVLVLAGNDYVSLFRLSRPADIRVEAMATGLGDSVIELYDNSGLSVAYDDDGGGGTDSRAEMALPAGTYCLQVASFAGGPLTGTVRVGLQSHEPLTPGIPPSGADGCDPSTPAQRLGDGPIDGRLGTGITAVNSAAAQPFYRFTLGAPAQLTLTAENEDADPYLYLYDGQGTQLAENDDSFGLNSQIDMTQALPAGEYCVGMRALSDPDLPITLRISGYDEAAAMSGMFDTAQAAPPLDGSHPITDLGVIQTRARTDVQVEAAAVWHRIEVSEGGLLLIEAVGIGNPDPTLTVFDDFGRQLAYNDDSGMGFDSLVALPVTPGTYLIAVRQLGSDPGTIRLGVERYVPAQ